MRTRHEHDYFDNDNDEPSWRRDERDDTREARRRQEEHNRNVPRTEPRPRPEQSQVGRGYGGNDRRYGEQSYWDADDRHYEWGVRSPEDASRFGRDRDRYDRFANERFAGGSSYGNQRGNFAGYAQSPNRSPSGTYGSAGEYARRPRDAWDDESYGRAPAGWGTSRWDGESSSRSYGAERSDGFLGRITRGQTGKGPKGYVRSDERIREDVCDRLSEDDEVDAGDITVTVKGGEVTLEGTVTDRRSKHRAEDITDSVSGVREVTNRLRTRKGLIEEIGDKLKGEDDREHRGHSGSGTRNSPAGGSTTLGSSGSPSRI